MNDNILEVKDLKTYFRTRSDTVKAVDGVSFNIIKGEVFGLVGESGSGKTLTALSVLRLISPPGEIVSGQAIFNGRDVMRMDVDGLRKLRGSGISIVFQEPATAFNPVFTVGYQVSESVTAHQDVNRREAGRITMEYFKKVHIADPERIYHSYPHQISGGTKQRAMIAMALVNSPELLILDEPTTALDVTIQAQVLDTLKEIIGKENMSVLFISHDFGVIANMCDRLSVMHEGKIVETGSAEAILNSARDPYTVSLIDSVKALS